MNQKLGVIVGIGIGIVISLFVMGFAFKVAAPTMFFKEIKSSYDFEKTVDLLVHRINKQRGWHVTTVINQEKEILEYGGSDVGKVKIIKFCNAHLSGEMLQNDTSKYMAVKMPLSIAVYEKNDGEVMIGMMNGYIMARLFAGTSVGDIMEDVVKDIENIMGFMHFRFTIF